MATNPFGIEVSPEQQAEYDRIFGVSPEVKRERALLKINQKQSAGEEVTAEDYASLFGAPTYSPEQGNVDAFLNLDASYYPPEPIYTPTYNPNTFSLDMPEGFNPSNLGYDERGFEHLGYTPEAGASMMEQLQKEAAAPMSQTLIDHYARSGGEVTDPSDIFTGGFAQNYQQANDPSTIAGMWREDSTLDPHFQTNFIQQELTGLSDYLQQFTWGENEKAGFDPQWLETGIPEGGIATDAYDTQDAVYAKSNHRQFNDLLKHQGAQAKYLRGLTAPAEALAKSMGIEWTAPTFTTGNTSDNVGLFEGMQSLQELFRTIDEARAPNVQKAIDLNTPNLEQKITDTYTKVFGEDADQFMGDGGPEYWFDQLLNDPNNSIPVGGSISQYLEDAFKNSPDYKTWAAGIPPVGMTDDEMGLTEDEGAIEGGPTENPFDDPLFDEGLFDDAPVPPFGGGGGDGTPSGGYGGGYQGGYGGGNQGGGGSTTVVNNYGSNTSDWSDMFNTFNENIMNSFNSRIDDLQKSYADSQKSNEDLLKGFREEIASRDQAAADRQYQEAAYGERTVNREVKGVKTLNELPGYTPKSRGTRGHFNRAGSRLKTSSLNVA